MNAQQTCNRLAPSPGFIFTAELMENRGEYEPNQLLSAKLGHTAGHNWTATHEGAQRTLCVVSSKFLFCVPPP